MSYQGDILDYCLTSEAQTDSQYIILEIRNHKETHYSDILRYQLTAQTLPFQVPLPSSSESGSSAVSPLWQDRWSVFVERAQDSHGVLSDTVLFDTWRRIYLDNKPQAEPKPKIFSTHQ
jgi:hypothetical protein